MGGRECARACDRERERERERESEEKEQRVEEERPDNEWPVGERILAQAAKAGIWRYKL